MSELENIVAILERLRSHQIKAEVSANEIIRIIDAMNGVEQVMEENDERNVS